MDDRVERLLKKAEDAADSDDFGKTEAYLAVFGAAMYARRVEARELNRMLQTVGEGNA